MGYEIAKNKAWDDIIKLTSERVFAVKFLADEYTVDLNTKKVLSLSCNIPAKDFTAVIILHYLARKLESLPKLTGLWLSFKELSGVEGYYPAFRKRVIEPILKKYGTKPEGILESLGRLPGKKIDKGDVGIALEVFEGAPCLITLWRPDDEFGPEANILFDKSITQIFCIEDIVVLAGIIAISI